MNDFLDDVADGIHRAARVTGVAWVWDRIVDLTRPVMAPLVAPLERAVHRRSHRAALADLDLADRLERAGLADSANRLREAVAQHAARWEER